GARAERGRRRATAIVSPSSRAARAESGRNADEAGVSRTREKDRVSGRAAGFSRATSTNARSRSSVGRTDCALDGASARRSARTNRARHFRNAARNSSLQTLWILHHQRTLRYLFGFVARGRVALHSRTANRYFTA